VCGYPHFQVQPRKCGTNGQLNFDTKASKWSNADNIVIQTPSLERNDCCKDTSPAALKRGGVQVQCRSGKKFVRAVKPKNGNKLAVTQVPGRNKSMMS